MANGPIPEGMDVLHTCDNPSCVRPDHLFIGTDSDNQIDCCLKGRKPRPVTQKLAEGDVRAIRASRLRARDVAKKYGVSRATIYSIRQRKTWKNT